MAENLRFVQAVREYVGGMLFGVSEHTVPAIGTETRIVVGVVTEDLRYWICSSASSFG